MSVDNEIDYKCNLSKEAQKIAFEELREDENTRSQALEQFRAWILKHPSIKRCRTDPVFLLRFLRAKKFSVPMAQEMLERYLQARQLYPDWFQNLDINDPSMEAIIDAGYLIPLLEKDEHGRQVILSRHCQIDSSKYGSKEIVRIHVLTNEVLMDDEENQVLGYKHLFDESEITMSHVSAWSFMDIRILFKWFQNSAPMRHKKICFISIPSYASKFLEFTLSLLNEKLRTRVSVHKNVDDFKKTTNLKILPKEYGGTVPVSDMIAAFKDKLCEKHEEIKALNDMYIEISPKDKNSISDAFGGVTGSFRKLEID